MDDARLTKSDAIKQALSTYYDIRFNGITGKSEYCIIGEEGYNDVDSDMITTFRKLLKENGMKVSKSEILKALEGKMFDRKKDVSESEEVEMYLLTVMDVRFNTIKQKPEYKRIGEKDYKPISKYFINSIKREITAMGLKTSTNQLNDIFFSDFSEPVDPVKEYFNDFEDDVNSNAIAELASTVMVRNPANWQKYLTKWLVAVVANALNDEKCMNHTMLVLTGEQGAFKTTWLDNLCPPALRQYLYTGKVDPQNKDTQTYIAEFFLINIDDQLRQLNKKDENEIKNMITTPNVKYRRPYDIFIQEYPHLASFMGSVNGNDFLTDPTGSRRFLPFEVLSIDINRAKNIDIDEVWHLAYHLYKNDFRYWFTGEEVDELNKENQNFAVTTLEEQFLLQYFVKPEHRVLATHFMQSAEILSYLTTVSRINLRPKTLGEALVKHGFEKWRKTDGDNQKWVYSVIQKNHETVVNDSKNNSLTYEEDPFKK